MKNVNSVCYGPLYSTRCNIYLFSPTQFFTTNNCNLRNWDAIITMNSTQMEDTITKGGSCSFERRKFYKMILVSLTAVTFTYI